KIDNIIFADSLFFSVFDFGVQSGSPRTDLGKPGMAFVTQSLAEKLGLKDNATTLTLDSKLELQVAGIVNDPPPNSHINFSLIVSMPSLSSDFLGGLPLTEWGMTMAGMAYIVFPEHHAPASMEARLKAFGEKYFEADDAARKSFHLQPLSDIHFNEQYALNAGDRPNVVKERLWIMAILGLVILAVACINFVNLATAMAVNKSKEIGVRKTLGAQRKQLIAYFLTESCVMTVLAVIVSLCFAEWLLPWLNNFLEKQMDLDLWTDNALQLFVLTLVVVTSLLSGLYPAIVLSGYQPVAVLKNKLSMHRSSGVGLRKVLVVFQFLVVQVLVVSTVVIGNQMNYLRGKPLGYDTEAVVNVAVPAREADKLAAFRTRMEANPDVIAMSYGLGAPTSENALTTSYYLTEKGNSGAHNMVNLKPVDSRYRDTYGLKLIAGRWFTETDEQLADLSRPEASQVFVYIINETTMRSLGARTPDEILGKHVTTGVNSIEGEVIGVVADFHDASLHEAISPVIFMNFPFLLRCRNQSKNHRPAVDNCRY
ncbi:MAG: FtsX-like permease family protein, partial [Bacteroidia bacterium]|nr:FtsX-like permease family protein [Bacteroidia bacterium]